MREKELKRDMEDELIEIEEQKRIEE